MVDLELAKVEHRLKAHNLELDVSAAAREFIAEEGFDHDYGARPLRRVIQRRVEDALSERLLESPVASGLVTIDLNENEEITVDIDEKAVPTITTQTIKDEAPDAETISAEAVS